MGCAAEMDGVIRVSSWVGYVTKHYRAMLLQLYDYIGSIIHIHVPAFLWDMVVIMLFYVAAVMYGMTRGTPVDVPLETLNQKIDYVLRRVPLSVAMGTTCMIFAGGSVEDAVRFAMLFWPMSAVLFGFIAWRMKRVRYQLDREHLRFLAAIWVLIAILVVLSQTQVFEYLAGEPPPAPVVDTPGPFGV